MSALQEHASDLLFTTDDLLAMPDDGKLYEVNEHRDRDTRLKLYSRRGVREYWIVDWQARQIEVHRRSQAKLAHTATPLHEDELASPLLPGFSCKVSTLFMQIPPAPKA
jgi:Uma2 family endonuclease